MSTVTERIQKEVTDNKIVLFMKGTRETPQCGFSATTSQCLTVIGSPYHTVDVLADEEVRQGIKQFSNWPTIPQLYINGKFVGGCDIVKELFENGELKKLIEG